MAQTRGPLRQSLATEHCDRVSRRCKFSEANLFVFARMPMRTPMKSLVIAGLLSALMIGRAHAQVYYTYSEWVSGRVPIEQLAKNVRTFVAARPDLQRKPVQVGLINYLIELCGAPPN